MRTDGVFVLLLAGVAAHSASFDCNKASTPQEKAICASPELSRADGQMAAAYRDVQSVAPEDMVTEIRNSQRSWLRQLTSTCNSEHPALYVSLTDCLKTEYASRTNDLQHMILRVGGITFVSHSVSLTASPPPPPPGVSIGTGSRDHGYLNASWPQAHLDTPEWEAWNKGIEAATVRVASSDQDPLAKDLKEVVSPDINADVTVSLGIVSQELVTATVVNQWDGGGIHPNENSIQFNWLLRKQRELRPEDVFRADSAWAKILQQRCDTYLHSTFDPGLGHSYEQEWLPGTMPKILHGIVTDPENWQLDSKGLTIIFQTYAVACHACTPAPALIPWQDLKPMLNPEFVPPQATCTARPPWGEMPVCK